MPAIRPITDLQRNLKEVASLVEDEHKPVYLTRNGRAVMVLVDADTYDEEMELARQVRVREERISHSIQRGLDDLRHGRTTPMEEAFEEVERVREEYDRRLA